MILIKKGQTNNISLSVSLNRTIQNPYYLFSFTHIQSKNQINFIPEVILINDRYDEFRFVEAPTTNLSLLPPQVYFQYDGQYWVEVYEQTSSGNTNPSQSGQMLWDGRAVVEDPAVPNPYYQWTSNNEDNANFIFISDDEVPVSPTPTPSVTPNIPTPTPTTTPSPTPTSTITPTPSVTPTITPTTSQIPKYPFLVQYDGDLSNLCSGSGTISLTLYGLDSVYQNNTNLYLDINLTIPAPVGYAEYLGIILEINPAGVVSGVVVCPSSTPTPTPTQTPTETPTPTPTPTTSPIPKYSFSVTYDGNLNMLCSGGGTITLTLYGTDPVYQNNTNLYLDNNLTISAPVGYAEYLGVILEINPVGVVSGVVVCPSPTPTITPTITPSITPSFTPTETPTPTPTPVMWIIGGGFDRDVHTAKFSGSSVYVGGKFYSYNGYDITKLCRLQPNGLIDTTFNPEFSELFTNEYVRTLEFDNNGYIYAGGNIGRYSNLTGYNIIKLDQTGAYDTTFYNNARPNAVVNKLLLSQDGLTMYVGGNFLTWGAFGAPRLAQIDLDGNIIQGFTFNGQIFDMCFHPDGDLLVVGSFTLYAGVGRNRIVKINPTTGAIDATFAGNIGTAFNTGIAYKVKIIGGKIWMVATGTSFNGNSFDEVVRLNLNGTWDTPWVRTFGGNMFDFEIDTTNGWFYYHGNITEVNGNPRHFGRLDLTTGVPDTTFSDGYCSINISPDSQIGETIFIDAQSRSTLFGYYTGVCFPPQVIVDFEAYQHAIRRNLNGSSDTIGL